MSEYLQDHQHEPDEALIMGHKPEWILSSIAHPAGPAFVSFRVEVCKLCRCVYFPERED